MKEIEPGDYVSPEVNKVEHLLTTVVLAGSGENGGSEDVRRGDSWIYYDGEY